MSIAVVKLAAFKRMGQALNDTALQAVISVTQATGSPLAVNLGLPVTTLPQQLSIPLG